jgi:HEAT repeat protein
MVAISLQKQQSASERLRGVSLTSQVSRPDPEFLATLIHTLNYDPNVDVRLAAVDALSRFAEEPAVRDGLVRSLPKQDSPMVQISLIDLLVQLHERQSIEVLKQLTNDANQNQQVRQRAQWGLQKLI